MFILILLSYVALGVLTFFYFFGIAFNTDDTVIFIVKVAILGLGSSFLLSFLASRRWPKQFYVWGIVYSAATLFFGLAGIGNISAEGPSAFFVWFGIGIAMCLTGLGGGFLARSMKLKSPKS